MQTGKIRADFKWADAKAWILGHIKGFHDVGEMNSMRDIAYSLVELLSNDQIVDRFRHAMEEDGFLEPSDGVSCPECGCIVRLVYMINPDDHLTLGRESICMGCHDEWLLMEDLQCRGCGEK